MKKNAAFAAAFILAVICTHSASGQPVGKYTPPGHASSSQGTTQRTVTVASSSQWTQTDTVNGIRIFRDERTGLEWTQTIGQVQSSGMGVPARTLAAKYGFRLPSFRELQVMEANGGFRYLNINNRAYQYYETSNSNILGNAFRTGFRTPQQRQGTGMNWVIGVREPVIVEDDGFQQQKPTVTKSTTTSKPVIQNVTNKPTSNVSQPTDSKPVLPGLPNYDD
ncbi:MAG: hypothetical protein FWE67_11485 [Planctomycetaceae bacterium]|nr:hypothetical protein [Planctomycetaceae bacterium]